MTSPSNEHMHAPSLKFVQSSNSRVNVPSNIVFKNYLFLASFSAENECAGAHPQAACVRRSTDCLQDEQWTVSPGAHCSDIVRAMLFKVSRKASKLISR